MKLWKKISISNICVLLTVVTICSTILLVYSKDNMIIFTTQQVQLEQNNLSASFFSMAEYFLKDETNPLTKRSGVEYCFRRFANEASVLIGKNHDDISNDIIYSNIGIEPQSYLPIDEYDSEQKMRSEKIDGKYFLIVGSAIWLSNDIYFVYIARDVTEVYDVINAMIWRFIIVCGIGVMSGTALIIFLIQRGWGTLKVEEHILALEETAKRQQLFIGGITHEFKTPMTSVIIHSDTLLSADLSQEESHNSLMHIREQCLWLEQLTQKLLKIITLEENIKLKSENVNELFHDVSQNFTNIPLEIDCKIETMQMDYDLMKSLLINLINNASKASEAGQAIYLQAYENNSFGGNILEVRDNGKGIPQDEIGKITDPFYMADLSRSKKLGGSGLGLALVKRIADAHGAELVIESEVGTGTTVKVLLTKN